MNIEFHPNKMEHFKVKLCLLSVHLFADIYVPKFCNNINTNVVLFGFNIELEMFVHGV